MKKFGVRIVKEGVVTFISLSRPEVKNAIHYPMARRLSDIFQECRKSSETQVVVLSGEGGNLSSGADVRYMAGLGGNIHAARKFTHALSDMFIQAENLGEEKMFIVRAEGMAVGGACGLLASATFPIVLKGTSFGFPERRIGLSGPLTQVFNVVNRIGESNAARLFSSGEFFGVDVAKYIGLIPTDSVFTGQVAGAEDSVITQTLQFGRDVVVQGLPPRISMPLEPAIKPPAEEVLKLLERMRNAGEDEQKKQALRTELADQLAEEIISDAVQKNIVTFLDKTTARTVALT